MTFILTVFAQKPGERGMGYSDTAEVTDVTRTQAHIAAARMAAEFRANGYIVVDTAIRSL